MTTLHTLTIKKFLEGLKKKEFSALEIAQACFSHIKNHDKEIGAFLRLHEDAAVRQAEEADLKIARGEELSPLSGVPMAIKDNILIKDEITTAGSEVLSSYRASYDATVIQKLKKSGAVFLGKTNLDEFAMGSSTENSAFQLTRNPYDKTRVPGGSSGGSAAAVAAHFALASLGSDTGGSIREPAAFSGVVGLKTTYGSVSRNGLIALASSLDQIGPFTKTVEDAGLVFNELHGWDDLDATSQTHRPYGNDLLEMSLEKVRELTIGIPDEYFVDGMSPEVIEGMQQVQEKLKGLKLNFKKISLPHTKYALSCYYIILPAEASSNLARFDGIRYSRLDEVGADANLAEIYSRQRGHGFGNEPKRRIILGTFVLSSGYYDAYYTKAQKVRALIAQDFEKAFKEVDVILTPTVATPAFKIGEKSADPLSMYLSDIFTIPVNLAGLPAISIPVENYWQQPNTAASGEPRQGRGKLPVGFQLIGKHFREADILGIGRYYEQIA